MLGFPQAERIHLGARKLWLMMLSGFRIKFLFAFGFLMEAVNIIIGVASYYFLTQVIKAGTSPVAGYGTDIVSYIIVGMALSPMLSSSMLGLYTSLVSNYYGRGLEKMMMTPTSIYTLLASGILDGYIGTIVSSLIYLLVGVLVFKVDLGGQNLGMALTVFMLGIAATWGLGMLLTSVFFYTDSGKSGTTPYAAFFSAFARTFSGASFPIEVVPVSLRYVALFLPQTHALRSIRLLLAGLPQTGSRQIITGDIAYLVIFALVTIPLGTVIMRRGLTKVMREGYSPRTSIALSMW